MSDLRIRDFGITIGNLPTGPRNAISDVAGVTVGHTTIDTPRHQTGVTVILPSPGNVFSEKLPAASFVLNGFGKSQGLLQIDELGSLETPIALTNTLNVGLVHDALVEYTLQRCQAEHVPALSVNPVVCECNDCRLNDITERAVTKEDVLSAAECASADFSQGAVGAGRGTVSFGFKGGIGSSSRVISLDGQDYTVGVLVQSNMGRTEDLLVGGERVGRFVRERASDPSLSLPGPGETPEDQGSIIMVVATDLPASDRQLRRICKRAAVGLVRCGSYLGHGSGDIMVAFSTAYTLPGEEDPAVVTVPYLNENLMEKAFRAAAEGCEEAILNSLAAADPVTGFDGTVCGTLAPWLSLYRRISPPQARISPS